MTEFLTLIAPPLLISFLLSWLIIRLFSKRLLDMPNLRSSHTSPTPRGGGVAIALGMISGALIAIYTGILEAKQVYWLIIPCGVIALLGFFDDLFGLGIKQRLIIQLIVAAVVIYNFDTQKQQALLSIQGGIVFAVMVLSVVWMTNLYNFMDGINGLAALEGISVCLGMSLVYIIFDQNASLNHHLLLQLASSIIGFLFWNFPRAKLFMGDAGSLFLGFSLGILALDALYINTDLCVAWVIMLAVFIVDASYTLFYRIISHQQFYQAHRTHAYQKCAALYNSHARVSIVVVAINWCWLLPLAIATVSNYLDPILAIVIAYAPLVLLAKKYSAGSPT